MNENLGEKIETKLKEIGMSQKDLAQKADLTESSISHYIKGDREPRYATLAVIAAILGVSVGYLLGGRKSTEADKSNVNPYDEIKNLIKKNVGSLSKEQKYDLIKLITN